MIIQNIHSCVQTATDKLLDNARTQEKQLTSKNQGEAHFTEFTVSGDGTWKKRGYTSLYGVTSFIGYYSGKILDICVKSAYCKQCEVWNKKMRTEEYQGWYESHKESCSANHSGSSGKMEVDAIIEMFKRSVEKFGIM